MDPNPEMTKHLHQDRESGAIVYPAYSRRAGGLSLGINLFPDRKLCSFDCPYCEVFPFETDIHFSLEAMERGLRQTVGRFKDEGPEGTIQDFSFSGNGEPTLSPHLPQALKKAAQLRDELAPEANLVVITNGSTLGEDAIFSLLSSYATGPEALDVWLKVDAGTEYWYRKMNRTTQPFYYLIAGIKSFAAAAPFTVQTMLCSYGGMKAPPDEARAWEKLVLDLIRIGEKAEEALPKEGSYPAESLSARGPQRIHLYGKARPAPEDPLSEALDSSYLEARAAAFVSSSASEGLSIPVAVFP